MTSQEWLGLFSRVVGVWHLALAGQSLISAIDLRVKLLPERSLVLNEGGSFSGFVFYTFAYFILGAVFIRRADWIVRFSYPPQSRPGDFDEAGAVISTEAEQTP